jgi:CheY-like chemotaxis protein
MEIVQIERSKAVEGFECDRCVDFTMVIDDVEEDIYVLEKMVERHYFSKKVIKCSNSLDALAYLQKHAGSPDQLPEIIFLDLAMPELNGVEFLEHFAKLPQSVRQRCSLYIYSSSKKDEELYMNGKHPIVAGFVPKPISMIYLLGVNRDHEQRHYFKNSENNNQPV